MTKSRSDTLPSNVCSKVNAQLESLPCGKAYPEDWGELGHFREENRHAGQYAGYDQMVVYLGDSITSNWANLGNSKRFLGKPVVNRGISGQVTAQMLLRFRQDVIDLHPKVVVILGGTNDLARIPPPETLPTIEANLSSMVDLAHFHGIGVVLASVLPVSDYERPNGQASNQTAVRSSDQIKELNKWIQEYSAKTDCIFLDYFSVLTDETGFFQRGLSVDGLHPNASAYALMESQAEKAVQLALQAKKWRNESSSENRH